MAYDEILYFGNVQLRCSPYISNSLSEALSSFCEFYRANGVSVIQRGFKADGINFPEQWDPEDLLRVVLRVGLDGLMDVWLPSWAASDES
jgi:hypothetical protein